MKEKKSKVKPSTAEAEARAANKTLAERGSIYGDYREGVEVRNRLMQALTDGYVKQHGKFMPELYKEYFWDMCNKLSRLSKCPNHIDSWHDIVGYGQLIESTIKDSGEGI